MTATTMTRPESPVELRDRVSVVASQKWEGVGDTGYPCTGRPGNDLIESWDSYFLRLALPGADPSSLNIDVAGRRVTIHGKYRVPVIEGGTYVRQGISTGVIWEQFELPAEVDTDSSKACYDRGILTVALPKVAYLKHQTIPMFVVG